jgi:ATP-dependent Clp protease protease subunit
MFKACYLLDRLEELDKRDEVKKDIEIIIDSYGGYIYHGLALISKILSLRDKGYKIITTVNSVAMSMGFMILLVGSERRGLKHSRVMCHQPNSGTWGTLQEMEESLEETTVLWNRMKELIIKHTDITDAQLEDIKLRKYDWFMWPEEALKLGVIDTII